MFWAIRTDDSGNYQSAIQMKAAQQAERDAQQAETYARAAALAESMTLESRTVAAESVPYLARKGFKGLMVQVLAKDYQHENGGKEYIYREGSLIVPLMDIEGDITTAEIINDSGKYALAGGRKEGSFGLVVPAVNEDDVTVVAVVEGYALRPELPYPSGGRTFCGMSKSGLLDAALAARKLHPDARIIVCGDVGAEREAEAAAAAVGGKLPFRPVSSGIGTTTASLWRWPHDASRKQSNPDAGVSPANSRRPEGSASQAQVCTDKGFYGLAIVYELAA